MEIKYFINDIDECISHKIESDGINFSENTIKEIKEYSKFIENFPDKEFIFCTGRALHQTKGIIERAPKVKWVITENGSVITDLYNKKTIDLGKNKPGKELLKEILYYAKKFASKEQIPQKTNMVTIDVKDIANPEYLDLFLKTIPEDLKEKCKEQNIIFNWDPAAINITLPITKKDGLQKLFEEISKEKKIEVNKIKNTAVYIGDGTSDIEGMQMCKFAACPNNGDEKNKIVQKYIKKKHKLNGYISKNSHAKGNLECLNYFTNFTNFFKDLTPLLGDPNQIRAGRIYPGGNNLNNLIGKKTNPEKGWFYPEAWIFSPDPAINFGSKRTKEGQTIIYDKEGKTYTWREYIKKNKEVLKDKTLNISVKLLDGSCTLPKEFHFKKEDEEKLKKFPLLKNFKSTLIKPEVWIRHPTANEETSPSFIGFNKKLNQDSFYEIIKKGVEEIEKNMNKTNINPGEALYIDGGNVHSLGKGLYFEILSDGDLKITLQKKFAVKEITLADQVQKLYTGNKNDLYNSLQFIDYSRYGQEILKGSRKIPKGEQIQEIITVAYFKARWIKVKPNTKLKINNPFPHILVTASGEGTLKSENSEVSLQTKSTTFKEFQETNKCYAMIIHANTKEYTIKNNNPRELIILQASE